MMMRGVVSHALMMMRGVVSHALMMMRGVVSHALMMMRGVVSPDVGLTYSGQTAHAQGHDVFGIS